MILPSPIAACVTKLNQAGFRAYAVGGCVRDGLLGRTPKDYDLCTDALPEIIREVFADSTLPAPGEKHGTVIVRTDAGDVEITTFRREGGYADHRHPDFVEFVTDPREDLARRDFTVNAMAFCPEEGLLDPFGGRRDLEAGVLRTVGNPDERFREDCLRILRGMRFAARYGLTPEPATKEAILQRSALLTQLSKERIFEELSGFLLAADAQNLMEFAPILALLIPELGATMDFCQHSPHHAYDVFTHTAHVTAKVPPELSLRWAALLHDIGKPLTFTRDANGRGHFYGHAPAGAALAEKVLRSLHAPVKLRQETVFLIERHMSRLQPERPQLREAVSRFGMPQVRKLLALQEADMSSKGIPAELHPERFREVRKLLDAIEAEGADLTLKGLAINGSDLKALGYQGKAIRQMQQVLLEKVLREELPNEREVLLTFARADNVRR